MSILIFTHAFLYFHTRRTAKTGLQCHTISSLQPAARQPAMASIACCSPRSQAARDGFNCAAARAARDGLSCLLQPGSTPCLQLLQRATCAGRWNGTIAPRQAYF